ncbi:unnamed protein product [Pelagomonas calceolata]|uniref:Uncharacterized protein n=1 Tax=Pelagomonas calceolata TaxID=35677 RepID=A0A8J2WJT4_9STRA|nr:unnamed protein product [Pelagomonas calceolata]
MSLTTLLYASIASAVRSFVPRQAAAAASVPRRATAVIDGLQELPLDRYDAIILDQYGVLHNGEALLDGVAAALERVHAGGARKLVVLSNTSKRRAPLIAELPGRGFRSEWLHDAICSGECCWEALRESSYASAVVLGWSDRDSSEYLAGTGVALADAAPDVIVGYGPDTIDMADRTLTDFRITGDLEPYRALLEDAAARSVPMLCANPDQKTIDVDGVTPLYMPGTMADAYRAMGGEVVLYGKPGVSHFAAALRAAGVDDAGRALMVGDSLRHDVLGAAAAGLDSLFVVDSGVHSSDLAEVSEASVSRLAAAEGVPVPTFVMRKFRW